MNSAPVSLHSITPFTMLDFPNRLAAIFWFSGCNLACAYCYNGEFLREKGRLGLEDAMSFLRSRVGLLEGVVLSGGEATLFRDLGAWVMAFRELGYEIKLDTNGTQPKVLADLLGQELLDYVALDFKGRAARFSLVSGREAYEAFLKSLDTLLESQIPFEVRTTVHSDFFDAEEILEMGRVLAERGYQGPFYLQRFVGEKGTLKPLPSSLDFELSEESVGAMKFVWR